VDEIPTKNKTHGLQIVGWTLIEYQQLMKFNLGINAKPHTMKINAHLETSKVLEVEVHLLKEFKIVFSWTYKDLKIIPPKLAQHKIELDTTIPLAHQTKYRLNPIYATVIKQDIYKLSTIGYIEFVEKR
jgi:hypothetical protein